MFYNGKEYKKYDENYYVSADGDIFSKYSKKILKHYIDRDGYHRVDIHRKHIKIHKLVYLTWIGPIIDGLQINHKDDNKNNNNKDNLYLGNQYENIQDCIRNEHRVGNKQKVCILFIKENKIIEFETKKDFLNFVGHPQKNGSLSKCLNKKWFIENYKIIKCND